MKKARGRWLQWALCTAWLATQPLVAQEVTDSTEKAVRPPAPGRPAASRALPGGGAERPANPVDRQAAKPLRQVDLGLAERPAEKARGRGVAETVEVLVGDLPAGKSISIYFDATVDLPFPAGVTEVSNQGTVSGVNFGGLLTDDPDDATSDGDPTVTPVVAMPDLAGATKTVADPAPGNGDGMAQPGEAITYTVTVTNDGNGGDSNVQILDTVPAGTTLDLGSVQVALAGGASGVVDASAGDTVDVSVASLPGAGGQAIVTFRATVDTPVAAGVETLSNTAQVAGDFTPPSDTTQADIPLDALPAFTLAKDDGGVNVDPGASVVYTLSYANIGDQDASNVVLEDTVPVGSLFDAGLSDPAWSCFDGDPEGTLCTLAVGTVAGGGGAAAVDFAVEIVPPQDAPSTVTNTATVRDDGAGSGGVPVEASDSDSTPVNDLLPPTIANVDTIKGNGDGTLEECESVGNRVSAFRVAFSEAMDEATVVDVSNWQLVGAGPDLDLSTEVCGPQMGDDILVGEESVEYDVLESEALVGLATSPWLEDGPYRLLACSGAGGMADVAGNELDGDGDFSGGDDFVRTFRIDEVDRFANGHFDCSIDDWVTVTEGGSTIEHDPFTDIDGASISGSAHFTNDPGNTELALGQCVVVDGEAVYDLGGFVLLDTPGVMLELIRTCEFFLAEDCSGQGLPTQGFFDTIATDGVWIEFAGGVVAPATAGSTLCQATLRTLAGVPYEAFLDDLSFDLLQSPIIFEDGFESGDTSAWSQAVP